MEGKGGWSHRHVGFLWAGIGCDWHPAIHGLPHTGQHCSPLWLSPAIYAQYNRVHPLCIWSTSAWLPETSKVYLAKDKPLMGLFSKMVTQCVLCHSYKQDMRQNGSSSVWKWQLLCRTKNHDAILQFFLKKHKCYLAIRCHIFSCLNL